MSMDWHFLVSGAGIMSADSMANPLRNTSLSSAEVLAREALQNSFDERDKTNQQPVIFKIKKHKLIGKHKKTFVDQLCFSQIASKKHLFPPSHAWFEKGGESLKKIDDPNFPLFILEVSDFNANGLGGRWNRGLDINDRFFNLVLSINRTEKQHGSAQDGALGSYGVGKMVFALCSNLRTMIYYSKFKSTEKSGGANARFMSTAFLPSFYDKENDIQFSGHAYFGISSEENQNPKKPLENEEADQMMKKIGFEVRDENNYGTSVFLPDCELEIEKLKEAIEKWWWPLLTDPLRGGELIVELEDENGNVTRPAPSRQGQLNNFIKAYNNLSSNFSDEETSTKVVKINHDHQTVKSGDLCLVSLPKNDEEIDLSNTVAFIRGGLVIEYNESSFREDYHKSIGVFLANEDYRDYFVFSEPEAHDRWNQYHDRLRTIYKESGENFMRRTINQIKSKARDFQTSQEKTKIEKTTDTLDFLDNILGHLIKPRKSGPPQPPQPSKRYPFIHKETKRINSGSSSEDQITFKIGLNDEEGPESMDYGLRVMLRSIVDSNAQPNEFIPINLQIDGNEIVFLEEKKLIPITLSKSKKISGSATAKVHSAWTTSWTIELQPFTENTAT